MDNNLQIAQIKEKKKLTKVIDYLFQEEKMANYLSVNLELQEEKECVKMITVILIMRMVKI